MLPSANARCLDFDVHCRPFCSLYNSLEFDMVLATTVHDNQAQFVLGSSGQCGSGLLQYVLEGTCLFAVTCLLDVCGETAEQCAALQLPVQQGSSVANVDRLHELWLCQLIAQLFDKITASTPFARENNVCACWQCATVIQRLIAMPHQCGIRAATAKQRECELQFIWLMCGKDRQSEGLRLNKAPAGNQRCCSPAAAYYLLPCHVNRRLNLHVPVDVDAEDESMSMMMMADAPSRTTRRLQQCKFSKVSSPCCWWLQSDRTLKVPLAAELNPCTFMIVATCWRPTHVLFLRGSGSAGAHDCRVIPLLRDHAVP